jgi:DNA-binding NarL/FixJ family response regulator
MIRMVLVDDQPIIRAGMRMLCESSDDLEVIGEADDGQKALHTIDQRPPDVVVMDLRMPGMDGVTATERITGTHPGVKVLVLTTFDDDDHLYAALHAGASGFMAKDASPEDVLAGIRAVAKGDGAYSPDVLRRIVRRALDTSKSPAGHAADLASQTLARLTEREREVLTELATGASNQQIAARLHIGMTTVKSHITALTRKTEQANRVQLAVLAMQAGLLDPE